MTLAIRMTEVSIVRYLTTSLRMSIIRPNFREVDLVIDDPGKADQEGTFSVAIKVCVSFLLKGETITMDCVCRLLCKIGKGDWVPHSAVLITGDAPSGITFRFDSSGHIS